MISFRFHVVSITAIFLAIAIGVVVGSTYVDGAVVDGLKNRIRTVESNVTEARDENSQLEEALDDRNEYIDLSAEFAVSGRLGDVPVLVMAARGVDEAAVEGAVVLARQAGGLVPGIVWLESRWGSEGDDDLEALATIVGGSASSSPDALWTAAWDDVVDELAGTSVPAPTPEATVTEPSTLEALTAGGFLSVDSLDDETVSLDELAGVGPRLLMVTGARADEELLPMIPIAVGAFVDGGLVTVVADVFVVAPEAPGRGVTLTESLDETLREALVLVDHLDLEPGRVAAVLSLDSAAAGEVGLHYGYGGGADGVLPAWTAP